MKRLFHILARSGLIGLMPISLFASSGRSEAPPIVRDQRSQPVVRDHRDQSQVRDHRGNTKVRDHRSKADPVLEAALAKAVSAALKGPEAKKLDVAGHEFNVKKATVSRTSQAATITGQLSHHLTARPDDQVHYTIKKSNGRVTSVNVKIDRGGAARLVAYPARLAQTYINAAIPASDIESYLRNLGQKIDRSWESSADLIVAAVALKSDP